ncbi:MAG TPA: Asp-tRNA(Asn)/Glu-tRNA(Gln) amidotransferase subunit GatC [Burkholderiales bacterium]|nr:Asp-tRNA(Asn)/Glu-tRNA(Gln) amidotransferase subunit GatC [Burkholderiales bacterium]
MSLSPDDVRRIARLARIALQPDESAAVTERLNGVLAMVEQIRRVDTAGIEPMAHAQDVTQPLREDSVTETDQRERYQAVAPAVEEGLYLVPKVVE